MRPPTPKTALQEPQDPVPEIAVTNNNEVVQKIYPSLPVEETTHMPMFKVNEPVVHFVAPPPTFLPKWEESSQGQPAENGPQKAKFSRRSELCSYFIKYANRRLDKERGDAINRRRAADFHHAILRALDLGEMDVNENEVLVIRIGHDTNLMQEEVLEGIFQVIFLLPSTKVGHYHQTTALQDFEANRPSLMINDPKTCFTQ